MRRIVAAMLAALPFDARSRRALDETLLDWAHEEAGGGSSARRRLVGVGALGAVARAVILSSVNEVGRVPVGWLLMRFAAVIAPLLILATVVPAIAMVQGIGVRNGLVLAALCLPSVMLAFMPPAIVLALIWRSAGRTVPIVGTAVGVIAVTLVLGGWVLPLAADLYRGILSGAVQEALRVDGARLPIFAGPQPGSGEVLGRVLFLYGRDVVAVGAFLSMTGLAALSGVAVMFAACLAPRIRLHGVLWLVAVPGGYLVALPHFRDLTSVLLLLNVSRAVCNGLAPWCAAVLVLTVSVVLSRGSGRADSPPEAARPASARIL